MLGDSALILRPRLDPCFLYHHADRAEVDTCWMSSRKGEGPRHIGDMLEIVVYLWVPQFRVLGKSVARCTGFFALWPRSAKRNEHHQNVLLRPISHSDAVDYRSSSNTKGAVQHDMNKTSLHSFTDSVLKRCLRLP